MKFVVDVRLNEKGLWKFRDKWDSAYNVYLPYMGENSAWHYQALIEYNGFLTEC